MNSKRFLLVARSRSQIDYFERFARYTHLQVRVQRTATTWFKLWHWRYLQKIQSLDVNSHLIPHFQKRQKQYPAARKTPLWPLYTWFRLHYEQLQIAKYCALIDAHKVDVVGVWNGQKIPYSSITMAAKAMGKEVAYFENGLLPNTTVCDWHGVNYHNSLPRLPTFYRGYKPNSPLPSQLPPRQSLKRKPQLQKFRLPKHYVFVPFQMEMDTQIINNSPWIRSMRQLYRELELVLQKTNSDGLCFVIKEHPKERGSYSDLYQKNPRIIFDQSRETEDLIRASQAVLTINSTVGFESILLNKKVLVLGNACYAIAGISQPINNASELQAFLDSISSIHVDQKLRESFLAFAYEHYAIPESWAHAGVDNFKALEKRLLRTDKLAQALGSVNSFVSQ